MSIDCTLLKNTFSNVVNDYDYARPKYPIDLYETIKKFANLEAVQNILEVGAGTGQATDLFLSTPYNLDLLEVSENQVDFLKEKYRKHNNISIIKNYFEEYETDKKYDLIYSATAFHWINSDVGYPKAWNMLKDGGTLAVFWQMSSVTYHDEGIYKLLNEIQKHYMPDSSLGFDAQGIEKVKQKRILQVQSGGYFAIPSYYDFKWIDIYDADRYVKLINTYSSTQLLDVQAREHYLDDIKQAILEYGGVIEMPQQVCLYMVHKY